MDQLREQVSACKACDLCQSRTQTVFMDGAITPGGVMFIGDAPGTEEDLQGLPFVGQAGQLLTDIIVKGMKMRRDQVTIANVIKCHPPGSRDSKPEERARCSPFLERQIELIQPKVLIPLGENAAQHILKTDRALTALRGQIHALGALTVIPTLHPEFLLQNPAAKRDCWQDIQLAMRVAGIETDRGA